MAFTYVGTLSTSLDQLRFNIGDTVVAAGPLPDRDNFADAELNGLLTQAGGVDGATALAFDALAARWAIYANLTVGPRREELSQIAVAFQAQAADWRKTHAVHTTRTAGTRWLTRADAHSDAYDAGDL